MGKLTDDDPLVTGVSVALGGTVGAVSGALNLCDKPPIKGRPVPVDDGQP